MKIKAHFGAGANVVITGGSSGIGFALAQQLVTRGTSVWLVARRKDVLDQAVEKLKQGVTDPTITIAGFAADVSDWEQMQAVARKINDAGFVPDVLINSAGVVHPGYVQELEIEHFHWMMDINYHGIVHTTKAFLPQMMERHSGFIVNISSGGGLVGVFGYTAYCASKFAVRGFSDALRWELEPYGIGVSVVYPSDTETPQLEYDIKYKPPETAALTATAGRMSAEAVAREILRGAEKGAPVILPGAEAKLVYLLSTNLGGKVIEWVSRGILKRVAKEQAKRNLPV